MTQHIIAIGQLPPPLHGFSQATAGMISVLAEENGVTTYDIAPPPDAGRLTRHLRKALRVIRACTALFRWHGTSVCYLGCEGGLGLVYTLLLVACARASNHPVYLHHHSFSYIDKPSLLMRAILAVGGRNLTHIFLCEIMRERFSDTYPARIDAKVVSNAAFIPPAEIETEEAELRPLTIGILSNLNREKGLRTFLELVAEARRAGMPLRAILAGPATDSDDRAAIETAMKESGGLLDYRGPIHGDAKSRFYRDIDVFVFPTTYANEAQPLVIFEAKAAGNAVIAFDRGCIRKQLDTTDLLISRQGDFVATALAWLSELSPEPALRAKRSTTRDAYRQRHAVARENARSLLRVTVPRRNISL
ncbi:glycosyltransferase family 4 protein [Rhizobium sp. S152]|uniref:glycosyltransferase family 4 protein n=1 Tax=Rhizobium sp. S152 TaxID=3055038 RepID=UPI0025AA16DA|nr:glycosyltransferase family 4 protein [Rhizobium sp. S152]MDM9626010.1 glycosyltransferase family 4 protein [Rhizobium sp. S152]